MYMYIEDFMPVHVSVLSAAVPTQHGNLIASPVGRRAHPMKGKRSDFGFRRGLQRFMPCCGCTLGLRGQQ